MTMFDITFTAAFTRNIFRYVKIDTCYITHTISVVLQDRELVDLDDKLVFGASDIPDYVLDWLESLPGDTDDGWTVCVGNASDTL